MFNKSKVNVWLIKSIRISGWALLVMIVIYMVSGFSMVGEYGFQSLINHKAAWFLHKEMTWIFIAAFLLHVLPATYYALKRNNLLSFKKITVLIVLIFLGFWGFFKTADALIKESKPKVNLENQSKTIRCKNCLNNCILKPGEVGKCKKFKNKDGKIVPNS